MGPSFLSTIQNILFLTVIDMVKTNPHHHRNVLGFALPLDTILLVYTI